MYTKCIQNDILRVDPPFPFCIHLQAPGPPSSRVDKTRGDRLEIGEIWHGARSFRARAVIAHKHHGERSWVPWVQGRLPAGGGMDPRNEFWLSPQTLPAGHFA